MTILDTNVVSEAMQAEPSPVVLKWLSHKRKEDGELHVTTITVAELLYGVELLPQGKRRASLLVGSETMFGRVFAGRILSFDEEAARAFAKIAAGCRVQGRPHCRIRRADRGHRPLPRRHPGHPQHRRL